MIRRVVIVVLLIAAGFAIGVWVGYSQIAKPELWVGAVGESFMRSQYASMQGEQARYAEAREAIEQYLTYLESAKPAATDGWKPGQNPWLDEHGLNFEKTTFYSRLAILHEKNAAAGEADVAWAKAESCARKGSWKEPTRDHLRKVIGAKSAELPPRT